MAYSVINKSTHGEHVQRLAELATTPGLQRKNALAALTKIGSGYAFSVSYGKGMARVAGNGSEFIGSIDEYGEGEESDKKKREPTFTAEEDAAMKVGMSVVLADTAVAGAAPMNKAMDTIHIPCGICVIVAAGGKGKTPLAHHLAGAGVEEYATIRVGEPFAGYTTNRETVARDLGRAMVSHSDIVLDSIKDLLAEGGSLMKGGIARAALTDLSAWATQAATLGCTIYIPLNPSGDGELVAMMTEVAKSNATMTISHVGESKWAYSSRTGEGMERVNGHYEFRRTQKQDSTQTTRDRDTLVKFDAGNISRDQFAGILQRSRSI